MSRLAPKRPTEPLGLPLPESRGAWRPKRGPVLFQLPPNLKKDLPRLTEFLALLPADHNAAFEFRNDTWFDDEVYAALKGAGAALVLSEREDNAPPPLVETAPWGYVRLRLESTRTTISANGRASSPPRRGARSSCTSCTSRPRRPMRKALMQFAMEMKRVNRRKPVTIAVDDDRARLRLAASAARGARLLRDGARRRRGHGASVHGERRERSRRARHRHACAISFRTWSAARSGRTRPSSRRRRCARRWRRRRGWCPSCRCSPAASPSAAA